MDTQGIEVKLMFIKSPFEKLFLYNVRDCSRGCPNSGNKIAITSSKTVYAKWIFKCLFWHNDARRAAPESAFAWPMIFPAESKH